MEVYLVGGAVRDKQLGLSVTEQDWVVVGATRAQMLADGFEQLDADFPVFIHPRTRDEYALARVEEKTGPGHKGFTIDASDDIDLVADLKRRDFTINAIAQAQDDTLVDPFDGLADLEARVLRHVSEAFVEDPLRVVRGARFVAKLAHLGFLVADTTAALMKTMTGGPDFTSLAAERLWRETEKALQERSPHCYFETLLQCGALAALVPTFEQAAHANLDAGVPPFMAPGMRERLGMLTSPAQRMAVIALAATSTQTEPQRCEAITTLYHRFGIPRSYAELVSSAARLCDALPEQLELCDAAKTLSLLELGDAFRRQQRFEQSLEVVAIACRNQYAEAICKRLSSALHVACEVDTEKLRAEGVSGKAFGEALHRLRLTAINDFLSRDG